MKRILLLIALLVLSVPAFCQRWSVGTNFADWASLGTVNLEGSYAVGRHWTVEADWDYNPWTYNNGEENQFQNRSLSAAAGARWWPWHVYSGWWLSGCGRYEVYNRGGILNDSAEEGDSYGMGLGFGYALMIGGHINIDFGIGLWGGRKEYTVYRCTSCGRVMENGSKWFFAPNDFTLSLVFVF